MQFISKNNSNYLEIKAEIFLINDSDLASVRVSAFFEKFNFDIIIIIIIIIGKDTISFMQGIYTYIPETNHVPKE
jgi:hypothetical protein